MNHPPRNDDGGDVDPMGRLAIFTHPGRALGSQMYKVKARSRYERVSNIEDKNEVDSESIYQEDDPNLPTLVSSTDELGHEGILHGGHLEQVDMIQENVDFENEEDDGEEDIVEEEELDENESIETEEEEMELMSSDSDDGY
ncbi:hypothetical protein COLO4_24606 [Corchorus olitorius]|uniref:Uncharacterized protein n=1 Tax=Corchorus olitorius TaxID=93759 RepID=A0A1R3I8S0_9ROSI|nr:hypothetical protein COLO4_24606 [Corchorus olitorius]